MKVKRQLAKLEEMILQPLKGVTGEDWHRAPKGRWSLAQILSHVARNVDAVVSRLEECAGRSDMERRATPGQHLLRHLALGVGKLPPGHRSPEVAPPPERPDPELATAQYRMAVERMAGLVETWTPEQQQRVFVHHPVLGDLNLPEWVRFFYVHDRHYAHQIEVRRRWLKQQAPQTAQKGPLKAQRGKKQGQGQRQEAKGRKARRQRARSQRKR
jgi:hypothetical protein